MVAVLAEGTTCLPIKMANSASESRFKAGNVIWIKCGQLHWPAEVLAFESLPKDVKDDFEDGSLPKVVAKFFDEDGYEFYDDDKNLLDYNCTKKEDFIKKGIVRCRQKSKEGATDGWFAKFPKDIVKSETLTGGDIHILEKDPYVERNEPKISYKDIFGTPDSGKKGKKKGKDNDTPITKEKGKGSKRKANSNASSPVTATPKSRKKGDAAKSPARPIVHPRFREGGGGSDHQVKLLPQPSAPYHLDLQVKQEKTIAPNAYTCQLCDFTAMRLNVLILHQKSHSEPAKRPSSVANARASSIKPKTPATSTKQIPSKRQSLDSGTKGGNLGVVKSKKNAKPSESPKLPPAALSKKKSQATPVKAASKKNVEQAVAPKPKGSTGKQKDSKKEPLTKKEITAKERNSKQSSSSVSALSLTQVKGKGAVTSPTQSPSTTPKKRKRMTKKEKIEREKKAEERNKIFDDWSEEEEGEAEERKKIKLNTKGSDDDDSDSGSDEDGEPAFLDDDNIHGYDDDDEEVLPPEPLKNKTNEPSQNKPSENSELKDQSQKENLQKDSSNKCVEDDKLLDIMKVLEETEMPQIEVATKGMVNSSKSSNESNSPKKSKRGVKFSAELSKDITIKKIQLVQTASNLADPMDVDDEFAFSEEPELAVAKPILKRPNRPPPKIIREPLTAEDDSDFIVSTDDVQPQHQQEVPFKSPRGEKGKLEGIESTVTKVSTVDGAEDGEESTISNKSAIKSQLTLSKAPLEGTYLHPATLELPSDVQQEDSSLLNIGSTNNTTAMSCDSSKMQQQSINNAESQSTVQQEQHVELQATTGQKIVATTEGNTAAEYGTEQEETYMLLVDDNSSHVVDSLNSQILYVDSNSLANGNVVLMTQDSMNAAAQQGNGFQHSDTNVEHGGVTNGTVLSIPHGGLHNIERQVVTSVDTKGGVATIPGQITSDSAASQIPLITTPALASAPLVSATAKPISITSTDPNHASGTTISEDPSANA